MKRINLVLCTLFLCCIAFGQAAKDSVVVNRNKTSTSKAKVPEKPKPIVIPTPEFINQPYYYDKDDNRLIRLDHSTAELVTKKKTLGLKGAKEILTLDNGNSKVRFVAKTGITFIIKTSGDVIDLTSYIKLYKFAINDDKREAEMSSKEGLINNKEEGKGKLVSFSVKMISKDNYMIQLPEQLPAGEYGFIWVKNMELKEYTVYAFGIEWKNSD